MPCRRVRARTGRKPSTIRPDTPRSWSNCLGSRLCGGIVTQNAGGYSFFRSGGTGRLLRMRFNVVPVDEPGRFIYLRDDGDFWSASWQPVGKPPALLLARRRRSELAVAILARSRCLVEDGVVEPGAAFEASFGLRVATI